MGKILLVLILIAFSVALTLYAKPQSATRSDSVTLYVKGNPIEVESASQSHVALKAIAEEFLITSNNALYEAVTSSLVSKVKSQQALEVIYAEPKSFQISNPAFARSEIKVDRILIPLEGNYAPRTVVYGDGYYSSGPFLNDQGDRIIQRIKEITTKLNY
jgi:hypothetical protein